MKKQTATYREKNKRSKKVFFVVKEDKKNKYVEERSEAKPLLRCYTTRS